MKRLIIADSHVGQGTGDEAAMCELLQRAASLGVGEVIYLGDAFQYLIGLSKFWTASVQKVLDAWRELRARSLRIVLVEGNRDFFLDDPELAREIDWSGRCYEFAAGERRFRLVHGDLVNRRDLQYRFWSKVSKSAPARLWAHLLPRSLAVAIVRRMEARLAETNRKFRYQRPIADLERAAAAAWDAGIDVLLWGHFHEPWLRRRGSSVALVMPAWLETRSSLLVESDGRWSLVDPRLEARPLPASDGPGGASPEDER